jgi:hypothetical protein
LEAEDNTPQGECVAVRKGKETRWGRTLGWWGVALFVVIFFIGYPTGFKHSRWVYGLIWGLITTAGIYLFRGFFERDEDGQGK